MQHDFHCRPDYSCHHLIFLTPGDPLILLSIDHIKSHLSRAVLRGIADNNPPMLTLNVRLCGSSKRLLHDLLCGVIPRVPSCVSHPSSPSSVGDIASATPAL
jgi:hypothetical protein